MSDLISREDVLALIDSMYTEIENHMPSAEPEQKWIPVTDRLPKDNRQVLVYAQSTHFALAKYDEMMEPNGEWKKQWVTFDAWKPYYTIKNVIAWMPLPERTVVR